MQRLLQTVLARNQAQSIRLAHDGREALVAMRVDPPDLMIADWIMAPMDGLELTRAIRRAEQDPDRRLPIILLTGASEGNLLDLAIDAGASRIVLKPLHAKTLVDSICRLTRPERAPTPFLAPPSGSSAKKPAS
jgi:PleD family two-component response regulator